jgi:hypothetical protein
MKRTALTAACAAAISVCSASAFAAKQCPIVGTWQDNLGTTATFTTQKAGTGTNANFCSGTYTIKVTKLTTKVFDLKGIPPSKACPAVSAKLKFVGGCTTASGTVNVKGIGNVSDTFNKTGNAIVRSSPLANAAINDGLK